MFVCGQGDSGQLGMGNRNEEDDMGEVARPCQSPLSEQNPRVKIHLLLPVAVVNPWGSLNLQETYKA